MGEAKDGLHLPEELVPHRVHAKELNKGRTRSWKEKTGAKEYVRGRERDLIQQRTRWSLG